MSIFSKAFIVDAGERAVKAVAGGMLTGFGSNLADLHVLHASALTVTERSLLLGVASLLLSIVSAGRSGTISPASVASTP